MGLRGHDDDDEEEVVLNGILLGGEKQAIYRYTRHNKLKIISKSSEKWSCASNIYGSEYLTCLIDLPVGNRNLVSWVASDINARFVVSDIGAADCIVQYKI